MKSLKRFAKQLWKDESGQGATEYILLLVVVIALVMIFKGRIRSAVEAKVGDLGSQLEGFTGN